MFNADQKYPETYIASLYNYCRFLHKRDQKGELKENELY